MSATLSYQWFSNTSASNVGGTVISGATGQNFNIPTNLAFGTFYYFVEVRATGGASPVRSSPATVIVQDSTPRITIFTHPTALTNVTAGSITGSLTVVASAPQGVELRYQWFFNDTASNIGGSERGEETTNPNWVLPISLRVGTWHYFVEVRADGLAPVRSNVATVRVNTAPVGSIIDMVEVPGGSFQFGGTVFGNTFGPVSTVSLSSFLIGKYPITQEQFQKVVFGRTPSIFVTRPVGSFEISLPPAEGEIGTRRPVEYVNWYDAIAFCNLLSMMEGLTPAYRIAGSTDPFVWLTASGGQWPTTSNAIWDAVEIIPGSTGYRLPTEAQWEFAARGGHGSPGNFLYAGSNIANDVAWYLDNSDTGQNYQNFSGWGNRGPREVGRKMPNGLGIHDMSGNVWEWCWDWFNNYTSEAKTNPTGPSSPDENNMRVRRGGSWVSDDILNSSMWRNAGRPYNPGVIRISSSGFRIARPIDQAAGPVISITTQPARITRVTAGNISDSLSVTASVTQGQTLSYQWFSSTNATNTGGTEIAGATNASFTIPTTLSVGSYFYFVEVRATGGALPVRSNVAIVNVNRSAVLATGVEMMWVPGGSFELGRDLGPNGTDQTPVSTVALTGFYMGKYPITQAQFQTVVGSNPSWFHGGSGREPAPGEVQGRRPVEMVNWYHALVFCNLLSIRDGLTPAYRINGSTNPADWGEVPIVPGAASAIWDAVVIVPGSTGYRLPTEAQWEYAAKGGNGSPGNFAFPGSNDPDEVAWAATNSADITREVGRLMPNGLGIHDMSGNVSELIWDWYGNYTGAAKTDPMGPASGQRRVCRGGSFDVSFDRSTSRDNREAFHRWFNLGFRVVRPQ
jgi:formylglycine-generating enzyme required for sulfatase activity